MYIYIYIYTYRIICNKHSNLDEKAETCTKKNLSINKIPAFSSDQLSDMGKKFLKCEPDDDNVYLDKNNKRKVLKEIYPQPM
jgi:hypothetical protein